jgi:hypothetical protein
MAASVVKRGSRRRKQQSSKSGGIAAGVRAGFRADKPRRSGGGSIQAEPLAPPPRNIPGTNIPDLGRSEEAIQGDRFDFSETPDNIEIHDFPNSDKDKGMSRTPPEQLPGIPAPRKPPIRRT